MEQKKLKEQLSPYGKVFADTPVFLYFFEENEKWIDLAASVFELVEEKEIRLITSTITTLEVITGLKKEGVKEDVESFENMLKDFEIKVLDFKQSHVGKAAQLRSDYGFKTPDSIQLAIAIEEQIPGFITNDKQLTTIEEENTKVVYLGDYSK